MILTSFDVNRLVTSCDLCKSSYYEVYHMISLCKMEYIIMSINTTIEAFYMIQKYVILFYVL